MIKRMRPLPQVPFGCILFMGAWRIEGKSASLRAVIDPLCTLTCPRIEYCLVALKRWAWLLPADHRVGPSPIFLDGRRGADAAQLHEGAGGRSLARNSLPPSDR